MTPTDQPAETPVARNLRIAGEVVLLGLVALSPWAFGCVQPRHEALLGLGVAALALLWAAHAALTRRITYAHDPVSVCLLGLVLLTAFQLVPLPTSVVRVLSPAAFERWSAGPISRIIAGVRAVVPDARVIGFPKGADRGLSDFVEKTQVNGVGVDWTVPLDVVRREIDGRAAIQGNLDPMTLVAGGAELDAAIDGILSAMDGSRLIFNLGHGITPEAPLAHVEQLVRRVRDFR